ncbi:Bcamf1 [Apiospora kogelbergensis]|uniref:Bcamf1 n=1 Tax=Apiospora kogelbergensis TaxID=1337665 RepID=A0AAW0QBC3_9PEZI
MSDEQMEQSDSELSDIVINTSAMTHHDYWARAAESTPTLLSSSSRRLRGRPVSCHLPSYAALELSPRRQRPLSHRETCWDSVATLDAPLQRRMSSYREYNGSRISHSRRTSILRDVYQMHEEPQHSGDGYTPPSSSSGTEKPHRHSAVSIDLLEAANQMKNAGYVGQMRRISGSGETEDDASSSSPDAIELGGHTYVRHGSGLERESAKRRRTLRKRSKGSPEGPDMGITHEILFFLLIATAQALMLSGVAQAMIPATVIGATFGLSSPADLAWFSAAYALTSGTFVLPAGRLGDLYGHKKIFIIGFAWFAVWSVMVGFGEIIETRTSANGVVYFDICRAMQGIGPALLVPNGQAMLGRAYTPGRRKALVMSLFGAAAPFGFVVGGVMAAVLAEYASWPWAFWVLGIVCAVLGLVSAFVLPPTEQTKKNDKESLWTQLDVTGMLCGVTGLVLFNFAWNQAPIASWTTPYTYFMLIIGLLLIGVFVYVEKNAIHPLVPVAAMRSQTNFVLACVATGWGCFAIWVFYYIQVVETLRGTWPAWGPHWIMVISMCAFAAGSLFMATAPVGQTYWANTFLSALIMPFGMDMSNPAASLLLSNSVAKEHQGIAASLVVTVVNYSISTALGFAATIEVEMHKNHISSGGGADSSADVALVGIRAAQWFGLGLGGLGICVALAFFAAAWRTRRKEAVRTTPSANATPSSEMRTAPSQGHGR